MRIEEKILIDGDLAEKDWDRAEKAADFFRAQPNRGVRAELKTEAMVLFDDATLYIGFRHPDLGFPLGSPSDEGRGFLDRGIRHSVLRAALLHRHT